MLDPPVCGAERWAQAERAAKVAERQAQKLLKAEQAQTVLKAKRAAKVVVVKMIYHTFNTHEAPSRS
eukprot:COSAG02_NODE_219_length_28538_cov_79.322058_11_plen_67_part_00